MVIELKVPSLGESVTEVQIGTWYKAEGEAVDKDEPVVSLESDKAALDVPAPVAGVLQKLLKREGDTVAVGDVIASIEENGMAVPVDKKAPAKKEEKKEEKVVKSDKVETRKHEESAKKSADGPWATPSARQLMREHGLSAKELQPEGRIQKQDVVEYVKSRQEEAETPEAEEKEEVVPMSPIRRKIAERLVQAQQQAALLTTFNEVDMTEVMKIREKFQEEFSRKHQVKLGFMSFFIRATICALEEIPEINAEIRGQDIVMRRYYHIGIAVSTDRGLVVPVLRHADRMSFAEIEKAIADMAGRARQNKLSVADFQGGTFSITNGGIFGSLLSTPIVNPPQSGILGMHAIQERPVARQGQVVIRPMMYVALTYDHRLVDGREAVTFLRRIKEMVEDPARLMFDV